MSSIYHRLNRDFAPSFEALVQEFVVDPIGLDPATAEKRRKFLMSYYKAIYDKAVLDGSKNNAIRRAYDGTRRKAQEIYVARLRDKKPEPPDPQMDLWNTTEKKKAVKI